MSHLMIIANRTIANRHAHSVARDYMHERLHELQFAAGVVVALGGAITLLSEVARRLA